MRFAPFLPLAALLLSGCGGSGSPGHPSAYLAPPVPADATPLRCGQSVVLGGLRLTFARVLADTRCPVEVQCPWSGDAEIEIAADPSCAPECAAPSRQLRLHTHLQPRAGEHLGWRVELVALYPLPRSDRSSPTSDYVAWLQVQQVP